MRIILFILFFISALFAEIGKISALVGDAEVLRDGKTIKLSLGTKLEQKDIISTKDNSKLQIIFRDNTIVTLGKNSSLDVNDYVYDESNPQNSKTDLNFFKGAFKTITGNIGKINKEKFKLRTKAATIGIRGTIVVGNQNMIACTHGAITVTSNGKSVNVEKNEFIIVEVDKDPSDAKEMTTDAMKSLGDDFLAEEEKQEDEKSDDSTLLEKEKSDDTSDTSKTSSVAEDVSNSSSDDDKKETTSTTSENQAHSFKGYILGANKSVVSTDEFIQNDDDFKAKRRYNTLSYDESISRTDGTKVSVSASKEFSNFDKIKSGGYTSAPTNSIGTIPFSYTNPAISGNYTVYADNMGEVFIGLYDSGNNSFNELFITGIEAKSNDINNKKIYVYKDFLNLTVTKNTSSVITSNEIKNYVTTASGGYQYYNPVTDNLTYYNKDFFSKGAYQYVYGDKSEVNSYINTYTYTGNSLQNYVYNTSSADIMLYGVDIQTLSSYVDDGIKYTDYVKSETSTSLSTSFLDKNAMQNITKTGSVTLKGYTSALIADNSATPKNKIVNKNSLALTIDRDKGDITGSIDFETIGKLQFNDDGTYYINDDLFGTMADETKSYYNNGTKYTLKDNSGYLISLPDGGLDSNDNPVFTDDDSSWGYWTANFDASSNVIHVDPHSSWVAGVIDSTAIDNVLNSATSTNYSFTGKVLGNVLTSSNIIENILVNDDNVVKLNFTLGQNAGSLLNTSSIKFKTTSGDSWNTGINTSVAIKTGTTGFSSTFTNYTASGDGIKGTFYGSGSIKSVGGIFQMTDGSSNVASGVFKATKD